MEVVVNGKPKTLQPGVTVSDLLVSLGMEQKPVAVERNGEIVTRAKHKETQLAAGDSIEVVHFVGGG